MRVREAGQGASGMPKVCSVMFGGFLALGIAVAVLAICAVMVSSGFLRMDAGCRVTALACLMGSLSGGFFVCNRWDARRLFGGLLAGASAFAMIALVSLLSRNGEFGVRSLVELLMCLVGGGLAGFLSAGRKKSRKRVRK